jgi:peroxiredoxin
MTTAIAQASQARLPLQTFPPSGSEIALFDVTGVEARARKTGGHVNRVVVSDRDGRQVQLADCWRRQPLVIVFFRGGKCMPCDLQLQAWRPHLHELSRLGAAIVGVSPQAPDDIDVESNGLPADITVLSDTHGEAARAFDLSVTLPPEIVDLYAASGLDSPVLDADGNWVLPIPATYVIDTNGRIIFDHVDGSAHRHADPSDVMAALRQHVNTSVSQRAEKVIGVTGDLFGQPPSIPWERPRLHMVKSPAVRIARSRHVISTRSSYMTRLLWLFGVEQNR